MTCRICQAATKPVFTAQVLNKYDAQYFHCPNCGFLGVEKPDWLEEAYAAPINISDTGILKRNISFSVLATNIIYYFFNYRKTCLDYAAGYGIFVRLMRDSGLNFKWQDDYTPNLLARGFEYASGDTDIELVTAFEVFEHFADPLAEIEKILKISKNILFSTTLLPDKLPLPGEWWYYGFDHGQHISFYSRQTFKFIAQKYGLNYYTNGGFIHLLTKQRINPFIFRILSSKKCGWLFWVLARLHFKSKTWADYLSLTNK